MALITLLFPPGVAEARRERLALRYLAVELPGAPAKILPADLDGDGRQDLAVAVAFTEWHQIGIEEEAVMDDVDGLVEVLTIVPSLIDRRELRVFLGRPDGGYLPLAPIELEPSVLSLEAGPPGLPILALTDDGLSALRLAGDGEARLPVLEPILQQRPVLAGTGTFIPDLGLTHDLDGDGAVDLLLPTAAGAAVYLSRDGGLAEPPAARLLWPEDDGGGSGSRLVRHVPLPEVRDVDGDALPDLLLRDEDADWRRFHVLRSLGDGRFAAAVALGEEEDANPETPDARPEEEIVYFGDLDGDGVAEWVTQEELMDEDVGMRKSIREAKKPPFRYRLYASGPDLARAAAPDHQFEVTGYAFAGEDTEDEGLEIRLPGGFQDLDGDGRSDLVTMTLDFSLMQAVKILATHRISIRLDFHVWCQDADGRFRAVKGLDLSGKFRLNLDDLKIGRMSQFAGDFDADGKADFVQMGRGRDVTIHRGRAGCVYPPDPDLKLRLKEEPRDLKLVRVEDFDGDGLTDLIVIQPQKVTEPGVTAPVRLDMYLSGGGE